MRNVLYYGDNLPIMRERVPDESVDLVYLDPPFNSNRDYNVLFKEQSGEPAQAQIKAFTDTWKWAPEPYAEFCETCPRDQLVKLVQGFVETLGHNEVTAYLVMMAPRLLELHRTLKPTGSLYLHCDPAASHYLKMILDVVFGPTHFRNEIVWKRTHAHGGAKRWGPVHDTLLFYAKSDGYVWNRAFQAYDEDYVDSFYRFADEKGPYRLVTLTGAGTRTGDSGQPWRAVDPTRVGRHWAVPSRSLEAICDPATLTSITTQQKLDLLDKHGLVYWPTRGSVPQYKRYLNENVGNPVQDVVTDVKPISPHAAERMGYPTQKPLALLERIVQASSNPGDIVLDPFCGCGTAVIAAHKLKRQWMGIDITSLATTLIKSRLLDSFGIEEKADYDVVGEPVSVADARVLFLRDAFEFQKWAISLVPRAYPYQGKKGADSGIDGVLRFKDDADDPKRCVIQVKGGKVGVKDIRDFRGVVDREKATLGLFITLRSPSRPMQAEADSLGFYTTPLGDIRLPRLQIRTIGQLLAGEAFKVPSAALFLGIRKAERVQRDPGQGDIGL